jgi:hypothetical protein
VKLPQALAELGLIDEYLGVGSLSPARDTAGLLHLINDVVVACEVQSSGRKHNEACVL